MNSEFAAVIQQHAGLDGAFVEIPFDVEQAFGAKRVKVKAMFDGAPYRGSVVRMNGIYLIGIPKALRAQIAKQPGDTVLVYIEKDEEERIVSLPEDFQASLTDFPDAKSAYEKLSYSHKKEYVNWIMDAKKSQTRDLRIQKAIVLLREGKNVK